MYKMGNSKPVHMIFGLWSSKFIKSCPNFVFGYQKKHWKFAQKSNFPPVALWGMGVLKPEVLCVGPRWRILWYVRVYQNRDETESLCWPDLYSSTGVKFLILMARSLAPYVQVILADIVSITWYLISHYWDLLLCIANLQLVWYHLHRSWLCNDPIQFLVGMFGFKLE